MLPAKRASVEFSVRWDSDVASHCDRCHVEKVDFWRDVFPGRMASELPRLQQGDSYTEQFTAGTLVPEYSPKNVVCISTADLDNTTKDPASGPWMRRYYPQGIIHHHFNTFRENNAPFLLSSLSEFAATADRNHPLSRYPIEISAQMLQELPAAVQRGGYLNDIGELVAADGPGLQLPPLVLPSTDEAWFTYPFRRQIEEDTNFYAAPRLVHHLDTTAREQVRAFYSRILRPDFTILDLMSSHESHLAPEFADSAITGLGMNKAELAANALLTDHVVHDLNVFPLLPFDDNCFDAVICTVSIEYLSQPYEVMSQAARVLRPGGICAITVSDRWFPGKQIEPWSHLHPFERQGMVLGFFLRSGLFENLHTESLRGNPRTVDDKHFRTTPLSDPLFFVWGKTK